MVFGLVHHTPEPYFRELGTLGPIKYLSFDCTTIWYIRKRCTVSCSFTSRSSICDPINIHWVTSKNAQLWVFFHSNSTTSTRIANWRIGGERASKTESFTYIWYCDTIRTQILNWSQSSDCAKMRNRQKTAGSVRFSFLSGLNLLQRFQFGSNLDLELNRQFGTVANTNPDECPHQQWSDQPPGHIALGIAWAAC